MEYNMMDRPIVCLKPALMNTIVEWISLKNDNFLYRYFKRTGHSPNAISIQPVEKINYDINFTSRFKLSNDMKKKVREKSWECHNYKPQPFPDTKRKRKPTKPNKHKSNKRTINTKISSLFPKWGNRNAKGLKTHKNKITQIIKQIAS